MDNRDNRSKLYEVIELAGMSKRPEYYSGRGATMSDLNSKILEKIFTGIEKHFGKEAAAEFIKMVENIKVLSATTFLQELYILQDNDWKCYEGKTDEAGIVVPKDKNGEYNVDAGMFGVMAALSRGDRDETSNIRGQFLHSHGVKPKREYTGKYGYDYIERY